MVGLLPRKSEGPSDHPEIRELRREVEDLRRDQSQRDRDQLRRELIALRARVAEAKRESEEYDRRVTGGPCVYCGISRSPGGWHGNAPKLMCLACADDRWEHDDLSHKTVIINRIISGDWRTRRHCYGTQAQSLIQRVGFRWYCETPGASPDPWRRWAYLDTNAVRERAAPTKPEPPPAAFTAGEPCERCGCAYMWTTLPSRAVVVPGGPKSISGEIVDVPDAITDTLSAWGCAGCHRFEDLNDVLQRVVGVRTTTFDEWRDLRPDRHGVGKLVTESTVERIGLTWYRDREVRTDEKARKVTLTPFAYLDLDALRRRAFEILPFASQWTNHNAWAGLRAQRPPRAPLVGRYESSP